MEYLATLLARAELRSTDLGSLKHVDYDPSYYGQPDQDKIRFYILPIPTLKSRAGHGDDIPPQVSRAAPDRSITEIAHVAFVHATARSNFVQILKESKLAASKLHHSDSESFFAQAHKLSYTEYDNEETARIAHTAWNLAKNEGRVLLLGLAWGTAETVHLGGEGRCIELTKGPQGGCVHHKNGRMSVIATRSHFLKAVVWRSDAQQPSSPFGWFICPSFLLRLVFLLC